MKTPDTQNHRGQSTIIKRSEIKGSAQVNPVELTAENKPLMASQFAKIKNVTELKKMGISCFNDQGFQETPAKSEALQSSAKAQVLNTPSKKTK
jgi:hypothetical protein